MFDFVLYLLVHYPLSVVHFFELAFTASLSNVQKERVFAESSGVEVYTHAHIHIDRDGRVEIGGGEMLCKSEEPRALISIVPNNLLLT